MEIRYVRGNPELKSKIKGLYTINAEDYIRFDDDYFSLFALIADEPVAVIGARVRLLPEPLEMLREVFVEIIEVKQAYQRKGIGAELLEQVIAWARKQNAVQIRSWSKEIRYEALMLWYRYGFAFSQVDFKVFNEDRYGFYAVKRLDPPHISQQV